MRGVLSRLGGFTLTTLVIAVANVGSIPLITAGAGGGAWADLMVGQSVGTLIGVVTAWGWAVTGATEAAAADQFERRALYLESLVTRGWLLLPGAVSLAIIVPLVVGGHTGEAALSAAAVVLGTTGGTWYFIGTGDARRLLLLDTLPRALGTIIGASAVAVTGALWLAPFAQLIGAAASTALAALSVWRTAVRQSRPVRIGPAAALRSARARVDGVVTALASNLYLAMPLVLVSRLAPTDVTSFALADRLLRYGVLAAVPLCGLAASWVPAGARADLHRRVRRAVLGAAVLGATGGVAYVSLARPVSGLLASGRSEVGPGIALAYGVAAACILATQILGPAVLIALGSARSLTTSTVLGLVVALVTVPAGALLGGGLGAAIGLAASEFVVLAFQCGAVGAGRRRLPPAMVAA